MTDTPRPELDLARLRLKYETILALRLRGHEGPPPVAELRALSLEFPGALRALDTLTLAHVHDRIDQIVSAGLDPARLEPWMLAELTFAVAMRGLKIVKAWLRGRKDVDAELAALFAREVPRLRDGALALAWRDQLAMIAQPPRGRLVPLAIARVAAALDVTDAEAAELLFRDDGRTRPPSELPDQVLLGVDDVPPPELPPAGAAPEPPLPPLPSDFLLELSPLGAGGEDDDESEAPEEPDEPDAGGEPDGLDDE